MAKTPEMKDEEYTIETRSASPAHLRIKIESFSLLAERGIGDYESREFEAGCYKWKFIISTDGEHISVQLAITNTDSLPADWEVNAMFNVLLYNQFLDNYHCFRANTRRFDGMKHKWGLPKLISKQSLTDPSNGYIVDDTCVFGVDVFVIKSKQVLDYLSLPKSPYRHKKTLEITNFLAIKGCWVSEDFLFCNCKWNLQVYPSGKGNGCGKFVSVFIGCDLPKNKRVKSKFQFCLKNQLNDNGNLSKLGSRWFSNTRARGFPQFVPIEDMRDPKKGFLLEDGCVFEVKITVEAISINWR